LCVTGLKDIEKLAPMKEVTIKYKSNKTLEALRELGKYLNFSIADHKGKRQTEKDINGIPVIMGDGSIDISALHDVFTGKNLSAKELRDTAWQRKK
jgi:hypothetical protein